MWLSQFSGKQIASTLLIRIVFWRNIMYYKHCPFHKTKFGSIKIKLTMFFCLKTNHNLLSATVFVNVWGLVLANCFLIIRTRAI